jgi:hypothetical protein
MTNKNYGILGAKVPTYLLPLIINLLYFIIAIVMLLMEGMNPGLIGGDMIYPGLIFLGYGLLCLLIAFLTKSRIVHAIFALLPPVASVALVGISKIINK